MFHITLAHQAWIGGNEFNWSFPRHARLYVAILSLEESGWIASYSDGCRPRAVKIPDSQKRKYMAYVESNNWTVDAAFLAANNVTRETLASSLPAGEVLNTLLRVQARYEQSQQDEEHDAFADDLEDDVADDDNEGEGNEDDDMRGRELEYTPASVVEKKWIEDSLAKLNADAGLVNLKSTGDVVVRAKNPYLVNFNSGDKSSWDDTLKHKKDLIVCDPMVLFNLACYPCARHGMEHASEVHERRPAYMKPRLKQNNSDRCSAGCRLSTPVSLG